MGNLDFFDDVEGAVFFLSPEERKKIWHHTRKHRGGGGDNPAAYYRGMRGEAIPLARKVIARKRKGFEDALASVIKEDASEMRRLQELSLREAERIRLARAKPASKPLSRLARFWT